MKKYINKYMFMVTVMASSTMPLMAATTNDGGSPLKLLVHEPTVYSPQVMELMRYDNHATLEHGMHNSVYQSCPFQGSGL